MTDLNPTDNSAKLRPIVLVLEDNFDNLEARRLGFENRGCEVIGATNAYDAIREVSSRQGICLAMVDINLDSTSADDVSGLAFARYLKNTNRKLPVAGYSAHFAEDTGAIPDQDRDTLFTEYYSRSKLKATEINKIIDHLSDVARKYLEEYLESLEPGIEKLGLTTINNIEDFRTYRGMLPSLLPQIDQVRGKVASELIELSTTDFPCLSRSIYLFSSVRSDAFVELEVFGVPMLYSEGESLAVATSAMIEVMEELRKSLKSLEDVCEPAASLAIFLDDVLV